MVVFACTKWIGVKWLDRHLRLTLVTFLLGVLMGALDSGIVSPALTTFSTELHIDMAWTVWVVTVYTLVYAVSMPLVGKLADMLGRKKVFLAGVILFAIGSVIAGMAQSFVAMLIGRAVQALGGGGIIPIANAVIGNSFPREKRGMALGLIGAMFGVATILGPNIGGLFIDQFNWRWIFFINVPISLVIVLLGLRLPEEGHVTEKASLDIPGAILLSAIIVLLLLGLTNLETDQIVTSFLTPAVWPLILGSIVLVVPFVLLEKRVADPMIKLAYFKDKNIVLALLISMLTGIGIISMIFVPSFSETLLGLSEGQGGYVVSILAVASGIAAPLGGVLLDKWDAKKVVIIGFSLSLVGALILSLLASGWVTLASGLAVSGIGIGFTMGTPLNYIMLELTPESESGFALSLVSLFRSIGTSLGPVILVAFLAGASGSASSDAMTDGAAGSPSPEVMGKIREAVLDGFSNMYTASAVIFFIGIGLSLFLRLPRSS